MLVLGIDFETTVEKEVDPLKLRIIEIGAVLWDTDRKVPVRIGNQLCWGSDYPAFHDGITDKTGITKADLVHAHEPKRMIAQLIDLMSDAEACVAHNGTAFDRPLLETECARHGLVLPDKPWIDTMVDIQYPERVKTRALEYLAAAHGFLNPFSHRAVFDVLTMLRVLSQYDAHAVLHRSQSPQVTVRAITQKPWEDGGASNAAAKELGFRFDGTRKIWIKNVLADEVAAEIAKAPALKIVQLKG